MKHWTALLGFAALSFATGAGAQTLLSPLSLSGSANGGVTSIDYRYTRHTTGGSGRGGHGRTYYSWDPYTDQQINATVPMVLNGTSNTATAAGTFYAPTYGATAAGTTSVVSNTANSAVFTTSYNANTILNTPSVAYQRVVATATAGSTFTFTLTDYTDVTVTATGSANGALTLYGTLDEGTGPILGLSGAGTVSTSASLSPGNYWITSSTSWSALQDTQLNSFLNIGTTNGNYSFKVTFTKGSEGGGGGD